MILTQLSHYKTSLKKITFKKERSHIGKILWWIHRVGMIMMAMIINADILWFKCVYVFLSLWIQCNYKFTFHHRQAVGFLNLYEKKIFLLMIWKKMHFKEPLEYLVMQFYVATFFTTHLNHLLSSHKFTAHLGLEFDTCVFAPNWCTSRISAM